LIAFEEMTETFLLWFLMGKTDKIKKRYHVICVEVEILA